MFDKKLSNLCVVVLESPYTTLNSKEARDTFSTMINTKIDGYVTIHDQNVLPVDTTDFLATHLIVADKEDPYNTIYMSYKSTTYKVCDQYNIPFPFATLLKNNAHPRCYAEMEKILSRCKENGEDLSYDTGWTIHPKVREDKDLQIALKEILTTLVINHHRDYKIPHWVTLGICKVKTDQYFLKMGLSEISEHPIMSHPYLHQTDARAVIAMDNRYTNFTYDTAKKHQALWDERIVLDAAGLKRKTKVAA